VLFVTGDKVLQYGREWVILSMDDQQIVLEEVGSKMVPPLCKVTIASENAIRKWMLYGVTTESWVKHTPLELFGEADYLLPNDVRVSTRIEGTRNAFYMEGKRVTARKVYNMLCNT